MGQLLKFVLTFHCSNKMFLVISKTLQILSQEFQISRTIFSQRRSEQFLENVGLSLSRYSPRKRFRDFTGQQKISASFGNAVKNGILFQKLF